MLLSLLFRQGFCQSLLSGRFIDRNRQAIPYLVVTASIKDSILSETIPIPQGSYTLKASLFGKKVYEKQLIVKRALDLGVIPIQIGLQLGEVAVSARKKLIEQKVDRLVFNMENTIAASGGDSLDALKITLGLRVENDKISMIGKWSLRVMVDSRMLHLSGEDLTSYLKSISADDIKSIEVIITPPAKYEAEGNSGLINIIYKKGRKDAWNADLRSSYFQGIYPSCTLGGTFSYRKNKLSLLLNASAETGAEAFIERYDNRFLTGPWTGQMNKKRKRDRLSGRIALDYKLSKRTLIGFQYLGSFRKPDEHDKSTIDVFSPSNTLHHQNQSCGRNDKVSGDHSLDLHYLAKWDSTDKRLSIDLDYFSHHASQDRNFVSQNHFPDNRPLETVLSTENTSSQDIKNYSVKADVEQLTKWAKLSYGAKLSFTKSIDAFGFSSTLPEKPQPDLNRSGRFQYKENTQALYLSAPKKLTRKWQSKLGLRLENTQVESISKALHQIHKNDYIKLFPSCYLTCAMNADQTFSLSY